MTIDQARQLQLLGECFSDIVLKHNLEASLKMTISGLYIEVNKSDMEDPTNAGYLIASMMFRDHLYLISPSDDHDAFWIVVHDDN